MPGRFTTDLSSHQRERLEKLIERLPQPIARGTAAEYERISLTRAKISRLRLQDSLDEEGRIALRAYGRYGLLLNRGIRKLNNRDVRFTNVDRDIAMAKIREFNNRFNITTADDINKLPLSKKPLIHSALMDEDGGAVARSFRYYIDEIIQNNSHKFPKEGFVYRISRAKKNVYVTEEEAIQNGAHVNSVILPGDHVMERTLLSTATESSVALFRYTSRTNGGQGASNSGSIASDEEELLFIIENNHNLNGIDISGFKVKRAQENKTSGEVLVQSYTRFKVLAIHDVDTQVRTRLTSDKRIVVLRPVAELADTMLRNPFNGDILPI